LKLLKKIIGVVLIHFDEFSWHFRVADDIVEV